MDIYIKEDILQKFDSVSLSEKMCLFIGIFLSIWYGWILDDAYIYFRYVDNLVIHKIGLVFNPGEFVEGFSSPAWAVMLIILRFFHLNYWLAIQIIGVIAYILFWCLAIKINRHLSQKPTEYINFPLIYLTCTYGVICYFTSGLESPLVILSAAGYAALFLFPKKRCLQILVGLSPFIRHELLLPYFIIIIWIYIRKKQFPLFLILPFGISGIGYGLFRVWYYADIFPNTFYLKDEIWITQGITYLYDTLLAYQIIPVLGIMSVLYVTLRKRYGTGILYEEERLMMLISALPVLLYVIKIGGDPRHFRYLAFPFCLAILAIGGILERVLSHIVTQYRCSANIIILCCMVLFVSNFPRQLQQHPLFRNHWGFSYKEFLKISDAAGHRFNKIKITPALGTLFPQELSYQTAKARFHREQPAILVTWGCQPAYLSPKSFVIHSLGLTEPFLARTPMKSDRPAHKLGLAPLAKELSTLRKLYGFRQGVFSQAIDDGIAPEWGINNITSLESIENKAYNQHILWENLLLAFTHIEPIKP